MERKVTTSSHFRVVVIGMDNDNVLHIRLFLKGLGEHSFSCLNDQLCSSSYAIVCDPLSRCNPIKFEGQMLWESLPTIIPMQATLPNLSVGEPGPLRQQSSAQSQEQLQEEYDSFISMSKYFKDNIKKR